MDLLLNVRMSFSSLVFGMVIFQKVIFFILMQRIVQEENCSRGGVVFSTPNHLQESIYSIYCSEKLCISNSIPFLLVFTNNELDVNYYGYEYDLNSIFYGIKRCSNNLIIKGSSISMHRYCNLNVSVDLSCHEIKKENTVKFSSFPDYESNLLKILDKIIKNASDSARKCQYKLVTTISRGYDASAASALVHDLGCNIALTFSAPEKYLHDSGVDVARCLGYAYVIEGNGSAYMNNKDLWEAESAASGDVGCLVAFNTFEKEYENSILFLGLKGDSIWGKDESNANRNFDFIKMSIAAEQNPEHYLRNNTIAISVPLILGQEWETIYKISNSEEMEPFSVGGDYDRPIPRRIVEERGVPRSYFGFKKQGAGFTYRFQPTLRSLRSKMSATSYNSLILYKKSLKRRFVKYFIHSCKYYWSNYPYFVNYVLHKLHIPFSLKNSSKYISSPMSSLLILWGMDIAIKKYEKALKK